MCKKLKEIPAFAGMTVGGEKEKLSCPKCGSEKVRKDGFDKFGRQAIKCNDCGRWSSGVDFEGFDRLRARGCVCLNCGNERVRIHGYTDYGFTYYCKECGSTCVVEKGRLSCEVEKVKELFRELGEHLPSNLVMRFLRRNIFVEGKEIIGRFEVEIRFVVGFEGFKVPEELVGCPRELLGCLMRYGGVGEDEFCKISGFNRYVLEGLLVGRRFPNNLISRQLETATGVSRSIWLAKGRGLKG